MFLSKSTSWLLFFALLRWECVLGAHLPHGSLIERSVAKAQNQPEPRANAISANPGAVLVSPSPPADQIGRHDPYPPPNPAKSLGIHVQPLERAILPQAVGQCLIQALATAYNDFGLTPKVASNYFHHSVSSSAPIFNVQLEISPIVSPIKNLETRQTRNHTKGEYVFTHSRFVETLSLLGFEYSNQQNASSMVEYTFDVVIDVWQEPEVVIATGSVRNIDEPDSPKATITPNKRSPITSKVRI